MNIKFHSKSAYDEKYLNTKVKEFNLGEEIPKEGMNYTCIACINIDSVMKTKKIIIYKFI